MSIDMKNVLNFVRMGGATLSGATPANTSLVDMQGYEGLTVALLNATVTVSGTGGFTLKLQHSDSTVAGSFVDCTANDVIPTAAGAITISSTAELISIVSNGSSSVPSMRRNAFTSASGRISMA